MDLIHKMTVANKGKSVNCPRCHKKAESLGDSTYQCFNMNCNIDEFGFVTKKMKKILSYGVPHVK